MTTPSIDQKRVNTYLYDLHAEKSCEKEKEPEKEKEVVTVVTQEEHQTIFLSQLRELKIINQQSLLEDNFAKINFQKLDSDTLTEITKLLDQEIVAVFRDGNRITYTLFELLKYIKEKFTVEIKDIEIVGSYVFWILMKFYLKRYLKDLGIENPDQILTPELLATLGFPNDLDLRINIKSNNELELTKQNTIIEDFFISQLKKEESNKKVPEGVLRDYVQKNAFYKKNTHYEKSCYSTISINGEIKRQEQKENQAVQQRVELLIVQELERLSLFTKDSLRFKIDPLINGMSLYGSAESLIDAIQNKAFLPEIFPESDLPGGQAIVDKLGGIVRAKKRRKIDRAGLPLLINSYTKGLCCTQPDLENILCSNFLKSVLIHLASPKPKGKGVQNQLDELFIQRLREFCFYQSLIFSEEGLKFFETAVLHAFHTGLKNILLEPASIQKSDLIKIQKESFQTLREELLKLSFSKNPLQNLEKIFLEELERAEKVYRSEIIQSYIFWIDKIIKNHTCESNCESEDISPEKQKGNETAAIFSHTFHMCNLLNYKEHIQAIWEHKVPQFSDSKNLWIQEVISLKSLGVTFKEISAFLQVKAFLHWSCQDHNQKEDVSILNPIEDHFFIRIYIDGCYLCWPLNLKESFEILANCKIPEVGDSLKELFPIFSHLPQKKLNIDWQDLEVFSSELMKKNAELGLFFCTFTAIHADVHKSFKKLIDYIPKLLTFPGFIQLFQSIAFETIHRKLIEDYQTMSAYEDSELGWIRALAKSDEKLAKKGYDLWKQKTTNSGYKVELAADFSKNRPDLAILVLQSLNKQRHAHLIPKVWIDICTACQKRLVTHPGKDLLELVDSLKWIFPTSNLTNAILPHLTWLGHELVDQKQVDLAIGLVDLIDEKSFLPDVHVELQQFYLSLLEKILEQSPFSTFSIKIWEVLKKLKSLSNENSSRLEELKIKVSQSIDVGKIALDELYDETFSENSLEKIKETFARHARKHLKAKLENGKLGEADLILKKVLNSKFDFSKNLTLKKHALNYFHALLSTSSNPHFLLADELLSHPKFRAFFSSQEIISLRAAFMEKAFAKDSRFFNRLIRKNLKLSLEMLKNDHQIGSLPCLNFMIPFLEINTINDMPIIKGLIESMLGKLILDLNQNNQTEDAVKFLKSISFRVNDNRVAWIESQLPKLITECPKSLMTTMIFSLSEKLLQSNPSTLEIETLFSCYQSLEAESSDWFKLLSILLSKQEFFPIGFKFVISFFEKNHFLEREPEVRKAFWQMIIEGFEKFPEPQIWELLQHVHLIIETFDAPEENLKRVVQIINPENIQKNLKTENFEVLRGAENILRKDPKTKEKKLLLNDFSIKIIEILSLSLEPNILVEASNKMIERLLASEIDFEHENVIFKLSENLCKASLNNQPFLLENLSKLMTQVRKTCNPLKIAPLINLLGMHSNAQLMHEASLLLENLKKEIDLRNLKLKPSHLISLMDRFLYNATHHYFEETYSTLTKCFEDIKWLSNIQPFFELYFIYISKRSKKCLDTESESTLKEVPVLIQLIQNNLCEYTKNEKLYEGSIKIILELIASLEIKEQTTSLTNVLHQIGKLNYERLTHANSSKNSRRPRKAKSSQKVDEQPLFPILAFNEMSSNPLFSSVETYVQTWRMVYLDFLISRDCRDNQEKKDLLELIHRNLKILLKTDNKNSKEFDEIIKKILFIPFLHEELEFFLSHQKFLKEFFHEKISILNQGLPFFKERIEKVLAKKTVKSIKQAIFLLHKGRSEFIQYEPEILEGCYALIIQKILKSNFNREEENLLLSLLQSEVSLDHQNNFLAKWNNFDRNVSNLIFNAILDSRLLPETKLSLAYTFLKKIKESNCFAKSYTIYLKLIDGLMRETLKIKNNPKFFVKAALKIPFFLAYSKSTEALGQQEKRLRAETFLQWIECLSKAKTFEALFSIKKIFLAQSNAVRVIFKDYPKMLESSKNIFNEALKQGVPKDKFQKGISDFAEDYKNFLLLLELDERKPKNLSNSELVHLDWILEKLFADNHVETAFKLLKVIVLQEVEENGLQVLNWEKWLEVLVLQQSDGLDRVVKLLEGKENSSFFKAIGSNLNSNFSKELINQIQRETQIKGELIRRKFIEKMIKLTPLKDVSEQFKNLISLDFEILIKNKRFKQAEKKLNKIYSACLPVDELFIIGLKLKFSQYGINFDTIFSLIKLLKNTPELAVSSEYLNDLIINSLSFLLSDSYILLEQIEYLRHFWDLCDCSYSKELIKKENSRITPLIEIFVQKALLWGDEELKELAISCAKEFPAITVKKPCEENLIKELESLAARERFSTDALKEIFTEAASLPSDRTKQLILKLLIKNLDREQSWIGSAEECSLCWLLGLKILHNNPTEEALYFLNNFEKIFDLFDCEELLTYKLTAVRSLFLIIQSVFEKKEMTSLDKLQLLHLRRKSSHFLDSEVVRNAHLEIQVSLVSREIKLCIISLRKNIKDLKNLENTLKLFSAIEFQGALSYQVEKAYRCLANLVNKTFLKGEVDYDIIVQNTVCAISNKIRLTCPVTLENNPFISNLLPFNSECIVEELCHLAKLEIPNISERNLGKIFIVLNKAIKDHLPRCLDIVCECLFEINQTTFCKNINIGILWDKLIFNTKIANIYKIFSLVLASLNGLSGNKDKSQKIINYAFDLVISFYETPKIYLKMRLALFKALKVHLYLTDCKDPSPKFLREINRINLADLQKDTLKLLDSYNNLPISLDESPALKAKLNDMETLFNLELLKNVNQLHKKRRPWLTKEQEEYILEETLLILKTMDEYLNKVLDSSIEDPKNFIELITEFVLFPYSQNSYSNKELQLFRSKKYREVIERSEKCGIFKNFPKEFNLFCLIFKHLKIFHEMKKLTIEEQKESLLSLLKRLADCETYSSLWLAANIVQVSKPEILYQNSDPNFFLDCYKIVISALEKYYLYNERGETLLGEFAKNTLEKQFFTNQRLVKVKSDRKLLSLYGKKVDKQTFEMSALPKKFLEEQSTNPLIKEEKTKNWQKAAAEINKELFLALCRLEINFKALLISMKEKNALNGKKTFCCDTSKNKRRSNHEDLEVEENLDFSKALEHLNAACFKKQFHENYEIYLECVSFLMDMSIKTDANKKDFKTIINAIFKILANPILESTLNNEMKEQRLNLLNDWVSKLDHDLKALKILSEALELGEESYTIMKWFPDLKDRLKE